MACQGSRPAPPGASAWNPACRLPRATIWSISAVEITGRAVLAAPVAILLPDPIHQVFVEVAAAAGAVAIVTGNRKHYAPARVSFEILSPAEFLERLR